MDPPEGCLEIGLEFVFEFRISGRSPTNRKHHYFLIVFSPNIFSLAYVDHHSLAVVMVVRDGMEVVLTRVLRILVDALLLMAADFWQRSDENMN